MVEQIPVTVIKRDGSREPFERPKILAGLQRACMKRPISVEQMEQIITNVEQQVFNTMEREVSSLYIGELVLRQLRSIDQVAYIRFASVYRQFNNLQEFYDEINLLMERDKQDEEDS